MYIIKTIKEILQEKFIYQGFKLCYIDEIPETIYEYTKESQEYMSRPDYSWEKEYEKWGWNNPNLITEEIPNPDFVKNEMEMYSYFTDIPLSEQWGDDWDDAPYEHNAGRPYDDDLVDNKRIEHTILMVPFYVSEYTENYSTRFPNSYGGGNSPWSVDEINLGAVPWIFSMSNARKSKKTSVAINAGINPVEFIQLLSDIKNLNK